MMETPSAQRLNGNSSSSSSPPVDAVKILLSVNKQKKYNGRAWKLLKDLQATRGIARQYLRLLELVLDFKEKLASRFKNRKSLDESSSEPSVAQSTGSVGNARMLDPDTKAPVRVLVYRLCSLESSGPWGPGKLIDLAKKHDTDQALTNAVHALLNERCCHDPIRARNVMTPEPVSLPAPRISTESSRMAPVKPTERTSVAWCKLRVLYYSGTLGTVLLKSCVTWGHVLLNGRGAVGETVLHLCCLLSSPLHHRIIRILVPWLQHKQAEHTRNCNGPALDVPYDGQPYAGEVALHFAVIQRNFELVQLLVSHGASVAPHASGNFLYSNINLYFGGTILGFAACLGEKEIVDYLIEHRADVNARDLGPCSTDLKLTETGMCRFNSVLHCCVLHQQEEMYRHLIWEHGANPWTVNELHDTPLLLAARISSTVMVKSAIDGTKQVLWVFGPVTCVRYPLLELEGDTCWKPGARKTVLQVIDEQRSSDLMYIEVIWRLLCDKWQEFAKAIFFWFVACNMVSLVSLTLSQCTAAHTASTTLGATCDAVLFVTFIPVALHGMPAIIGDFAYMFTLSISLYLLIHRLVTASRQNRRLHAGLALEISSCVLPWIACPFRFFPNYIDTHKVILGVSNAMGWMRFLQYAFKFSSQLGPLVLLVTKMLYENVIPFVAMYACFFAMFLTLLNGAYQAMGATSSLYECMLLLFQFTIGPSYQFFGVLEVHDDERLEGPTVLLTGGAQMAWIVLSNVILMNVLIAMMNTTYSQVFLQQEAQWRLQFLEQVLFVDATPSIFIPPFIPRRKRNGNYTSGVLKMFDSEHSATEVQSYFLQMELVSDGPAPQTTIDGLSSQVAKLEKQVKTQERLVKESLQKMHSKLDSLLERDVKGPQRVATSPSVRRNSSLSNPARPVRPKNENPLAA
ncbi:hypothetical protein AB1Y20_020601 [Prymnesium parvum]|uniref:Ion transport domain-containing protein n=1 Tax=Prymnesium parvum TaxID=97485 RepID=A0AB34JXU0_PRYPA